MASRAHFDAFDALYTEHVNVEEALPIFGSKAFLQTDDSNACIIDDNI